MSELKMGLDPSSLIDNYNSLIYIINSVVKKVNTVELVKVQTVDTSTNTLTVIPIVKDADAEGNGIDENPVFGVRYFEWQYGSNGIKATPAVGDIGLIVVCKKDRSAAETGIVPTFRQYSLSDGVYIGGIKGLNQAPTQYIEFTDSGINVTTTKDMAINCNKATIAATEINLGGVGGKRIALDGDPVKAGSTVVGNIQASSITTNSL